MNDNGKPIPINRAGDSATIRNRRNNALSQARPDALRGSRSTATLGALKNTFQPRDLTPDRLAGMNHAEWLEDFSKILALSTGVEMTAKREGTITRLHWSADYIKLLEQTNRDLEVEIKKLKEATPDGKADGKADGDH